MAINVLRSLKGYFMSEKRRTAILDSLITATFNYFTSHFSIVLVNQFIGENVG